MFHTPAVKLKTKGRPSGGIGIGVPRQQSNIMKVLPVKNSYICWCRIKTTHIIIGIIYIPPMTDNNIDLITTIFQALTSDLLLFESMNLIPILVGDFNSRMVQRLVIKYVIRTVSI